MYAHQVIEDLQVGRAVLSNGITLTDSLLKRIRSSQQFFIDTGGKSVVKTEGAYICLPDVKAGFGGINDSFDSPFMPEDLTGVKLPYELCFFSFLHCLDHGGLIKIGVLVFNQKNEQNVGTYVFIFNPVVNMWQLEPFMGAMMLNSDFSGHETQVRMVVIKDISKWGELEKFELIKTTGDVLCLLLQGLKLLSCKNITTVDNPAPEKLNKKRVKNGKQPLFTYKTLVIKPTSKKQTAQEVQGLWENRVHLCRGHFKTYTEKNPLFGSHTGRYWWQPSVRGNKLKGVVMKDYEVRVA